MGVKAAYHIVFHAAVDCHNVIFVVGGTGKPAFLAAYTAYEVSGTFHRLDLFHSLFGGGVDISNNGTNTPCIAENACKHSGVETAYSRDVVLFEHFGQGLGVAEVGRGVVVLLHYHASD